MAANDRHVVSDVQLMAARDAFQHLRRRQRRQVFRLAKRGQKHPDPTIRLVAYGWARWVVRIDDRTNSASDKASTFIAIVLEVVLLFFGDGGGPAIGDVAFDVLTERSIRRLAKIIVSLEERPEHRYGSS